MRRLLALTTLLALVFLASWGVLVWAGVAWVDTPPPALERGGAAGAALGVGLLAADVVLPVPSSLVMVALGRLYGLWWGGVLGLAGSVLSGLLAWALGRRGGPWVDRALGERARIAAEAWLARHGTFALALARPVPILAETLALLAGARRMPFARVLLASTLGILPAAFLYAWAGASARDPVTAAGLFAATLAVSGGLWWVGRRTA